MLQPIDLLGTYLHLARASQVRQRPHVRDRLLVLAGTLASRMRLSRIAACCREQVLKHNPRHMLSRWSTISEALQSVDFLHLLRHLQQRFSPERCERLRENLGIDLARERASYYSDEEYAAALLGTNPQRLSDEFGDSAENT